MSAEDLKRLERIEIMAQQQEAEAAACTEAAANDLAELRAAIAALEPATAAPLLDKLDTCKERLREAWQAEAARCKGWRSLADAFRPPCCAPGRPCKAELLATADKLRQRFDDCILSRAPRAFVSGGRRYLPSENRDGRLLVRDAETGALMAASKSMKPTEVDHHFEEQGAGPSASAHES